MPRLCQERVGQGVSGFAPVVFARIWDRDQGCCARCLRQLDPSRRGVDWSVHHRCPRSSGGTRRLWVNEAANGLLLCGSGTTGCHGWVESNRAEARVQGFLVSANGRLNASEVAVTRHALLGSVWLEDDGTWFPSLPEEGPTPESIEGWVKG